MTTFTYKTGRSDSRPRSRERKDAGKMKLKATKMRLYNLVLAHCPNVPPIRQTEFTKVPYSRSWWLSFDKPVESCEVYFSTLYGKPLLSIFCGSSYEVTEISVAELKKYDLLEGEKTDGN